MVGTLYFRQGNGLILAVFYRYWLSEALSSATFSGVTEGADEAKRVFE